MTFLPSDFKFSLAVGVAGAYVEVTSDVRWDNSITRTWGTQNQFIAPAPGVFQFTLDNTTGNYSPDNPASTLATSLGEGTGACWSLNGVLRSGQVRAVQPIFTDIGVPEASARMRVTVTDMLGIAALNPLGNLAYSQVIGSPAYAFWPLNDPAGSSQAAEVTGHTSSISSFQTPPAFGVTGVQGLNETQATFGPGATGVPTGSGTLLQSFAGGVVGAAGCWITTSTNTNAASVRVYFGPGATSYFSFAVPAGGTQIQPGFFAPGITTAFAVATVAQGVPNYFSVYVTISGLSVTAVSYMNGVQIGTATHTAASFPTGLSQVAPIIAVGNGDSLTVQHLSLTAAVVNEELAASPALASRLAAIDQTSQLIALGALPTDFSTAPLGVPAVSGQSAFDAIVAAMLTEQGYVDTTTAGTLLAPVQTIRTRARQRPVTPTATFGIAVDLTGAPEFARSLNDEISLEKVSGANSTSGSYTNTALIPRVGSANGSDTVLTFQASDLYEWASDRVWRGIKRTIDITSISLDACGGSGSSNWNTLTALAPGDRIHLTGLPVAQLGYSTWDGFLIGAEETHISQVQSIFKLFLAPCPPLTMIWDTDLWANGGNNTISTLLTSGATSMLCTSADVVTLFETSAMNYYLQVDSEIVKVTACSAAVAGIQTLTITRAQLGTTAAAHAVGVVPEVYADSTGRLNNAIWAF